MSWCFPPRLSSSERHPREQEQRIVLARGSSEAVIVGRTAVEAQVPGVLHADAQVDPRPSPGLHLAERYALEHHGVATRVRGAVVAAREPAGPVKRRIPAATDIEYPDAGVPSLAIRVGSVELQGVEVV